MEIKQFDDKAQLNNYFCQLLQTILAQAILERGCAFLVVSGGQSPQALFEALSLIDLDWQKVTVLLTDERWVSSSDSASNERMLKQCLLKNKAAHANLISLLTNHQSAKDGEKTIEQRLSSLPQFDVVILGMGDDGHTASLFPCSEEIEKGLSTGQAVIAVTPKTAPHERLSFSKNRLLNSRFLFLYLVGEKKLEVFNQALNGEDIKEMPIRAFLHSSANLQVLVAP